jgi:hypothetical protein
MGSHYALREISYRALKLSRVSAALGVPLPAGRGLFAAGGRRQQATADDRKRLAFGSTSGYRTRGGILLSRRVRGGPLERRGRAWCSRWPSARWPCRWPPLSLLRNFAARTRRPVRAMAFTPAPTPLLVVSRRKASRGVTGQRRQLRIGVGVTGGARAGGRIGRKF